MPCPRPRRTRPAGHPHAPAGAQPPHPRAHPRRPPSPPSRTGGFDETTTAAIARRAGIGVGTLYGYFPDKRAILLELLDGTVRAIADHVVDGLAPERWRERRPARPHPRADRGHLRRAHFSPGIQRILWERYFKDPGFRDAVRADRAARARRPRDAAPSYERRRAAARPSTPTRPRS